MNSEVPLLVVLVVLDLLAQTLFEHITSGPISKYEASLGSSRAFLDLLGSSGIFLDLLAETLCFRF